MYSVKDRSSFAQAALALDADFQELERLAGQLERHEYASDGDFEHAQKLLAAFGEAGQRIGGGIQRLANELEQARVRAEHAAKIVGERSILVQQRHDASQKMLEAFEALAAKARGMTETMRGLKEQSREALLELLPVLNRDLDGLNDDVAKLEEAANAQGLKGLAKNAAAMRQSLQAARERLRTG